MRKLKLIFATFALLLGVSNAMAQNPGDDMTSYITNPDAASDITGWTASGADAHRHSGNGFDGNAGFFELCTWGGSWDLSLSQTVNGLPNGYYLVKAAGQMSAGTDAWMKLVANSSESQFCRNGDTNGNILANGMETTIGSGVAGWRYTGVVAKVTNGTLAISVVGHSGVEQRWANFDHVTLTYLGAKIPDDTDLTYAINNHSFETGDYTGWTLKSTSSDTGVRTSTGNYITSGIDGTYLFNTWWQGVPMTQTIANMPNGDYQLKVAIASSDANADAKIFLLAEDGHSDVITITQGTSGTFSDYTYDFTVTDHSVTIGVVGGNDDGSYNADGHWWYKADNFRLTYKGLDLSTFEALLSAAITKAQGLVDGNTIPNAAETALQAVIDANSDDSSFEDEDQYTDAINAINTAYDTYKALEIPYAKWLYIKSAADALVAVENNNASANSTLSSATSTHNTAAEAATTESALNTATSTLKTAMTTYAGAADPTSGNRFDLTFMIAVPDMTDLWTGAWGVVPTGWATEQAEGNFQVMQNNDADAEDGEHKVFTEYYYLNSNTTWGNNKFNVYTTIEDLPVGTYTMSCYAFAKEQNYSSGAANPQVFFYANNTQGSLVNNSRLAEKSISFINDEQQDVKVGLKPLSGNTLNWMGIGYVKLYKEYTDNTTYDISTGVVANGSVVVTVDDVAATSAKALKTVTLTYTPNDGYYVSSVVASYNDGEEKTLDVANPSTNVYTFQMPAYDVTVTSSVVIDKRALSTAITNATNARKAANEGTGVFQIPTAAGTTLATAISAAQGVYDDADVTVSEVASAVTAMNSARSTYEGATLNAPDAEKRYWLSIVEDGKAWNGNAITFIAGGRSDEGNYAIKYLTTSNANLCQAIKFTATTGNKYKMSVVRADGDEQYLTTNSLAYGSNSAQIRTTTDASKALEVEIKATSDNGEFQLYNTEANAVIANNNNNDMYTANSCNFTIAEASQASVPVSIASDVRYATRIFPFTPTLPTGVEAYTASVDGDVVKLTLEETPAANTPYILFADKGYTGAALTGWGIAGATTATSGVLTGVYTETTATVGTYVLQKNDGKVGFYQVASGEEPTIAANRAYLTAPTTARALFFFEDEATGINAVNSINALVSGEATIFNAAGVQVSSLQKGMNIIRTKDGKTQKVMVK